MAEIANVNSFKLCKKRIYSTGQKQYIPLNKQIFKENERTNVKSCKLCQKKEEILHRKIFIPLTVKSSIFNVVENISTSLISCTSE